MTIRPRDLAVVVGVIVALTAGYFIRRAMRPTLSPDDQVRAELKAIARGFEKRKAGQVTGRLAKDFEWRGQNKDEIADQLRGAFFVMRDVSVKLENIAVSIKGMDAVATTGWNARWRRGNDAPYESQGGELTARFRKDDGKWKLVAITGIEPPPR